MSNPVVEVQMKMGVSHQSVVDACARNLACTFVHLELSHHQSYTFVRPVGVELMEVVNCDMLQGDI